MSVGKEVVGIGELSAAKGAFELLAGGVLGAATKFGAACGTSYVKSCADRCGTECFVCWNSSGSPPACGG